MPGKVGKKPTMIDNMGDMLAEQLLAIQATNADILQGLDNWGLVYRKMTGAHKLLPGLIGWGLW